MTKLKENLSIGTIVRCKREPLGSITYKEITGAISGKGTLIISIITNDGSEVFLYEEIREVFTKEEYPEMYL